MARDERQSIELTLHDLDELFVAPGIDPLNGRFQDESGIDRLVTLLDTDLPARPPRMTIALLAGPVSDERVTRCRGALRGYATMRIEQLERERARVTRQGLRELRVGLLLLAAFLLATGILERQDWLPAFVRSYGLEGLAIVGWIVLWHPVELLLFERRELARDRRVYELVRETELTIRAAR